MAPITQPDSHHQIYIRHLLGRRQECKFRLFDAHHHQRIWLLHMYHPLHRHIRLRSNHSLWAALQYKCPGLVLTKPRASSGGPGKVLPIRGEII